METQTISQSKTVKVNWTIPVRSIYSILVLIFLIPFTILNFIYVFIPGVEEINNLEGKFFLEDFGYIWLPILCYVLTTSTLFLFGRIFVPLRRKLLTKGVFNGLPLGIIGSIITSKLFNFTIIEGVLLGTVLCVFWTLFWGLGGKLLKDETT